MTNVCKFRVIYNGMKKAFPGLRIVSEEHEEYDGPVTVPRLHEDALREDVSLKSINPTIANKYSSDKHTGWRYRAGPSGGVDRSLGCNPRVHRGSHTGEALQHKASVKSEHQVLLTLPFSMSP